jgi:hypothetical protein
MRKIWMFLSVLLVSMTSTAQHFGYLGKKNFIDIKSVSYMPLIANLTTSFVDGDGLFDEWKFGLFNTGVHATIGRTVKQNMAISFEAGIDFLTYEVKDDETIVYYEKNHCISFMPKIEFSKRENILPLGVSHQIGIGYYKEIIGLKVPGVGTFNYPEPINGVTLMYALSLRSSITKSIFINYGVRYTLNYSFVQNGYSTTFIESLIPYFIYEQEMQKRMNFISVELGLTYVF